jgi:alpha-tubulin suppressor-like RCC1 family protein
MRIHHALAGIGLLVLAACGEDPIIPDARTVTRIELSGCVDPIDSGAMCTLEYAQFNGAGTQVINQPVSWRSDNPAIATVRTSGQVTGVADGSTTIHATVGNAASSAVVVVRSSVAFVVLDGCTDVLVPGGVGCTMSAFALSTTQQVLSDRLVTWEAADPEVAVVDDEGRVSPVARGHARVRATIEGVAADTLVAIGTPVYRVIVTGCEGVLAPESTCQFQLRTEAPNRQVVTGGPAQWESSDSSIIAIDATGMVSAQRLGEAQVTVEVDGVETTVPIEVGGFSRIVLGTGLHACGFKPDGRVYCWGRNPYGQLGAVTPANQASPVLALGGTPLLDLALGSDHSCGIIPTMRLLCWGWNENGQLGDGSRTSGPTPKEVAGGLFIRSVAAGWRHTCAIATNESTYCWGGNISGESGQPFPSADILTPRLVPGQIRFVSLVAGSYHNCGLDDSGRAWCWGSGGEGQLGHGQFLSSSVPVAVEGGVPFIQLIAGAASTCGLSGVRELYCWGRNSFGQAGNGTTTVASVPVRAPGLSGIEGLFGNSEHVCTFNADQQLLCWGRNDFGQVGDGTTTPSADPIPVVTTRTYVDAAAGGYLTCGLRASGALDCWGSWVPAPPQP